MVQNRGGGFVQRGLQAPAEPRVPRSTNPDARIVEPFYPNPNLPTNSATTDASTAALLPLTRISPPAETLKSTTATTPRYTQLETLPTVTVIKNIGAQTLPRNVPTATLPYMPTDTLPTATLTTSTLPYLALTLTTYVPPAYGGFDLSTKPMPECVADQLMCSDYSFKDCTKIFKIYAKYFSPALSCKASTSMPFARMHVHACVRTCVRVYVHVRVRV